MAGRGTDILLGGNPIFSTAALIREFFETENIRPEFNNLDGYRKNEILRDQYQEFLKLPASEIETENSEASTLSRAV